MPYPVIIFSVDEIRGGITKKILERNGFQALLLDKILGLKDRIAGHAAGVVVFDTCRCLAGEVRHLKDLCGVLENRAVILLGDPTIIEGFHGPNVSKDLCLSDPLDPDLVVSKVKEASLPIQAGPNPEKAALEGELKDLLKLQ